MVVELRDVEVTVGGDSRKQGGGLQAYKEMNPPPRSNCRSGFVGDCKERLRRLHRIYGLVGSYSTLLAGDSDDHGNVESGANEQLKNVGKVEEVGCHFRQTERE